MTCIVLATPRKCNSSSKSEITNALNSFFNDVSGGLGDALDIVDKIETTTSKITDIVGGITTSLSTLLEDSLGGFIESALDGVKIFFLSKMTPLAALAQFDAFSLGAANPVNKLFDAFGCLGSTVKKALGNTIKNMLKNFCFFSLHIRINFMFYCFFSLNQFQQFNNNFSNSFYAICIFIPSYEKIHILASAFFGNYI